MNQTRESHGGGSNAATDTRDPAYPLQLRQKQANPLSEYTIAWICALPGEQTAAMIMLDRPYETLPRQERDPNTYILGTIKHHNVVITCLPRMGTVKAASALAHLTRTFPGLQLVLIVGIGGGVPSLTNDIRLGDIIVGTRVMPYDLSKAAQDGLVRTDHPQHLRDEAMSVINHLRSRLDVEGMGNFHAILEERSQKYPAYGRPTVSDLLFPPAYEHKTQRAVSRDISATQSSLDPEPIESQSCPGCDQSRAMPRGTRYDNHPVIHYGAIASGSQVVKNAAVRDQYAQDLDVICFEMEAAGLMGSVPCIPIRGICDYSDTHKNDNWQGFAAFAAAAFARDLVEHLTSHGSTTILRSLAKDQPIHEVTPSLAPDAPRPNRRQQLLKSLEFNQMDSRKTSIQQPHATTCQWLLDLQEYKWWLDYGQIVSHHGFLWIRGKPGVGKSTLMKFAYNEMRKKDRRGEVLTASFFFNARGGLIERTSSGMFRSLLCQIFEAFPDLQDILDDPEIIPRSQTDCPSVHILKAMLESSILQLGQQRSITIYIDALDECDEQQVMDMIRYFDILSQSAMTRNVRFGVCFSSRHYPYINIRAGLRLTLEDLPGHTADLTDYIRATLNVSEPQLLKELETALLHKSSQVFLWVVLVIDILNEEYDQGAGYALRKRLSEVPDSLMELFKDIITRDSKRIEHLRLCVIWVLCASTPLSPMEFHHAMWSGLVMRGLADEQPPPPLADGLENMRKPVVSTSKGLAEITGGTRPTVQFIHESVRDFLIRGGGLLALWPELGICWESTAHDILMESCSFYLDYETSTRVGDCRPPNTQVLPFLRYAAHGVLYHADGAVQSVDYQFLSKFDLASWMDLCNAIEDGNERWPALDTHRTSLLLVLIRCEFVRLVRVWLEANPSFNVFSEEDQPQNRDDHVFFAAMNTSNEEVVAAVLGLQSTVFDGIRRCYELWVGHSNSDHSPLTWAAKQGMTGLVERILDSGIHPDTFGPNRWTALARAAQQGHQEVVQLLVRRGADVNGPLPGPIPRTVDAKKGQRRVMEDLLALMDKGYADHPCTALVWAARGNHLGIVTLLLDHDADLDHSDDEGRTSLMWAAYEGFARVVQLLLERDPDTSLVDKRGQTALLLASMQNNTEALELLVVHRPRRSMGRRPDLNRADMCGKTCLQWAVNYGKICSIQLLLDHGANVDQADSRGETPLELAINQLNDNRQAHISRILIGHKANVHRKDSQGQTLLSTAVRRGNLKTIQLLVEAGAGVDVHEEDPDGRTPIMIAWRRGHSETAAWLTENSGASITPSARDGCLLLGELSGNNFETARVLIEGGAEVNIREFGWTALSYACREGERELAELLISHGAQPNPALIALCGWMDDQPESLTMIRFLIDQGANVDSQNEEGRTPLMAACARGHIETAGLLLKEGANINIKDHQGRTALTYARDESFILTEPELIVEKNWVAKLLVENGGTV